MAQWILAQVSRGEDGFAVVGDTAEEYGEMYCCAGRAAARRWYWKQVRASAWPMGKALQFWRINMLKNDLKLSLRALKRNRLFSLINLSGLTVGLAAFTLIALYVLYETGFDRFHPKEEQLCRLGMHFDWNGSWTEMALSPPGYAPVLAESSPLVKDYARLIPLRTRNVAYGDIVHTEPVMYADAGVFRLFNFPLIRGDIETLFQVENRIALNATLAKKYFGDEDPLGQTLLLNNEAHVVEAVFADVPEQSHIRPSFLISMCTLPSQWLNDFFRCNFYTYLELAEGASPEAVELEVARCIAGRAGDSATRLKPFLRSVKEIYLHSTARYPSGALGDIKLVRLFAAIAIFVLLMACVNFINLTTSRSTQRAREVAVRKVLGSRRGAIIRQFLMESMLFALIALFLSQVLVVLALPRFNQALNLRLSLTGAVDDGLLLLLMGVTLCVGMVAGAYPAFFMSGFKPIRTLRGRTHTGHGHSRLRRVLVVFQFSLSIILIFSSLMVARQTRFMKHRDPGYDKENVVTLMLTTEKIKNQSDVLKNALLQEPGIISVSLASRQMGSVSGGWDLVVPSGEKHAITAIYTDEDYIETLGFRWVDQISSRKKNAGGLAGYYLNETAAQLLGEDDVLGQEVFIPGIDPGPVLGVICDFNYRSMHEAPEALVICRSPRPRQLRFMEIRLAAGQNQAGIESIHRVWNRLEPMKSAEIVFLDDHLNSLYWKEERMHTIVTDFSGLAVFIGALGLLGLAAYAAERRRKEIAIRKVMGATAQQIVITLCREFVILMAFAVLLAWPSAWALSSEWLQQFAYRIAPDFSVLVISAGVMLLMALLAVSFQTLKAAWANPVRALNEE